MPRPCRPCPPTGFTLVELLVVIFVIALISLLILGAVHRSKKTAAIARTKADIAAIATALEQYKSDFKKYPTLPEPVGGAPMRRTILAQALIGPGPASEDGADGPGFRTTNPATGTVDASSKVWPAYLSPEKFQVKQIPPPVGATPGGPWVILDQWGNPIRYYPKRRNFNPKLGRLVGDNTLAGIFDYLDGESPTGFDSARDLSQLTLQVILGDNENGNNAIDGSEIFRCDADFILASPGPDGVFPQIIAGESSSERAQKLTKTSAIFNFEFR